MIDPALSGGGSARNTLADPQEFGLIESMKKRLKEEKEARKPSEPFGPKELTRTLTAPVSTRETTAPLTKINKSPENDNKDNTNQSRELADVAVSRDLISLAPSNELQLFAQKSIPVKENTDPLRTEEIEAEPRGKTRPTDITRQSEEIVRRSADQELEDISAREAIATPSGVVPAKAGALLDLSV